MTETQTLSLETLGMMPEVQLASQRSGCPLCGGASYGHFLNAPDRFHQRREIFQLNRCADCGCVWLLNPPPPEEMPLHYDGEYHRAISRAGETAAERRWQRPRELISRYKNFGVILDIGCSSGGFLQTMRKPGWLLHGIELEPRIAERARIATGAKIYVGSATEAGFEHDMFDVITCFDVLEHMYDPKLLLSRVVRWLKPGGIFVVVLPNIDAWEARLFRSFWFGLELPRHLFHFSAQTLLRLTDSLELEEAYLRTHTCYLEDSLDYIYLAALRRLGWRVTPPSSIERTGILTRLARKSFRTMLARPYAAFANRFNAGGSMEAVFRKRRISGMSIYRSKR